MNVKLPFGLRDGKLVHISEITEAERGLKCNCVCPNPNCHNPLIACLGEKRIRYFKHQNEECNYAVESALHLFAKEIIQKNKKIKLPRVCANGFLVYDSIYLDCDKVELEVRYESIIPDVVIYKSNKSLFIEILVTHKVDENKLIKIKQEKQPTIELNLSSFKKENNFDPKALEKTIIDEIHNKEWLYNPKIEELVEEKKKIEIEKELNIDKKIQSLEQQISRLKNNYANKSLEQRKYEIQSSSLWKRTNYYLKLDINHIPPCVNQQFDNEIIFNCDQTVWQSSIFLNFIRNYAQRGNLEVASTRKIVEWAKKYLPLNWDIINWYSILDENKDYYQNKHKHPNFFALCSNLDLEILLSDFFNGLCEYGVLESSIGGYVTWFSHYKIMNDNLATISNEKRKDLKKSL